MPDDLGAPLTLPAMRDTLADVLAYTETIDGAPARCGIYLGPAQVQCLRRVHKLLEGLAPYQDRVRKIISGERR